MNVKYSTKDKIMIALLQPCFIAIEIYNRVLDRILFGKKQ